MNEFSTITSPDRENIIMLEIPCLKDSAPWMAPKEPTFDMCIGSLAEDVSLGPGDVKRLLLIWVPDAYPIYRKDYATHLNRLLSYMGEHDGISTLGRTGEFMYMDVDKCLISAFDFDDRLQIKLKRNE
jgi:hypothetical protein